MNATARHRWLTAVLATTIAPFGCARIAINSNVQQNPAGPATVSRGAPGPWTFTADLAAEHANGGTALRVTARRSRTCTVTRTTPFEEHRTITRTNETPRVTALAIGLGLASAAVAGVGLSRYLDGQSLCSRSGEGSCELNASGAMVLYGSAGTALFLTTGIYDLFAATDSSDDLGIVNHSEETAEDCGREPAGQVTVAVRDGDAVVVDALTDSQGRARLLVPASAKPPIRLALFVGGTLTNPTPSLGYTLVNESHAPDTKVATAEAEPASGVPVPARIATPTTGSTGASGAATTPTILPTASGDTLSLAGVALRGATREALQSPLEQAGALAHPDARRPHVARFDLGPLNLPVLSTLEILFDKDERFVGAKFSGPPGTRDEDQLLELLQKTCGPPQESAAARKRRWTWKLGGDIDMTLASGTGGVTSLVVRDLAAASTAKARSTSRRPGDAPF